MGIIFGIAKAAGQRVEKSELLEYAQATEKHALDGTVVSTQGQIGMGFQPYYTHQRSNLEALPLIDTQGNILSFDGRLDNHVELHGLLQFRETDVSDSQIVLKAFERWGEDCFSKLVGDWAIALWSHSERTLYLARDHAGTRTLYFGHSEKCILWSTYLETFFTSGRTADLD
jgi:asparagine synthase (glutamine-hydrolysing)